MTLLAEDRRKLEEAKRLLENPGFAAKAANSLHYPIEKGMGLLPDSACRALVNGSKSALETARDIALYTMNDVSDIAATDIRHKLAVASADAAGGGFGVSGLLVDLPISTTIMLRSIADIARSNGESIADPETKAECLAVFAMGGPSKSDDASESGYYGTRLLLAGKLQKACKHLTNHTVAKESAPVLVQFMTAIGERFGIQVTEGGCPACPGYRCCGRRDNKLVVHGSFSDNGARAFCGQRARTQIRKWHHRRGVFCD